MWAIGWSTTGSWITAFTFGAFGPPASLESGAQRTKQLERVGGFFRDFRESRTENGTEEPLRGVRHSAFEGTTTSVNPFVSSLYRGTVQGAPFPMRTILLLIVSNIFMTFAWYGHLKFRSEALWKVVLASWGIAFFEYCFQVPANRIGSYEFNGAQLKTIQEVITLSVFSVFSITYLGERFRWNYAAGFACIVLGAFFVFHKW